MAVTPAFRVPVMMLYHSVRDVAGGSIYRISISPERFRRHMEFLASNYRIVPLEEFIAATASRARLEGMACVTFDDGYVDNLGAAREILTELGIPATAFIPTGYVGRPYFWWDAMHCVSLAAAARPDGGLTELQTMYPALNLGPVISEAEWFRVWDNMRRCPLDETYRAVQLLGEKFAADLSGLPRPITMSELPRLSEWPFEIGSHAVTHRPLPSLPLAEMRAELEDSRDYLQGVTGKPVRTFSYPFGLFDHEVAQHCRGVGYTCAVSLVRDYRLSYADTFDLPRQDGADGDVDELIGELQTLERTNERAFAIHNAQADERRAKPIAPRPAAARPAAVAPRPVPVVPRVSPLQDWRLFRTEPVRRDWGWGHGVALDRPYIERFIRTHAGDIYGRVLEIKEPEYSRQFAAPGSTVDVLDLDPSNPQADIIDDVQTCAKIADSTYDCVILTQVIQLVPDVPSAIANVFRVLRPGGVLLITACGISQGVASQEGEFHWSFYRAGLRRLLLPCFDPRRLLVHAHGNAGLAASFLMGLTTSDIPLELLTAQDDEYPIVVTARAVKPFDIPETLIWPPPEERPDVSVIIPMFNAEATVKETLFSVSQQHYSSYEIIVVDDGSTDGSRAVVQALAKNANQRIRILEHPECVNRGLSLSRNLGLEHARGEFIVFLDADDTVHPGKFTHDVDILRNHEEVAAVVGRALWWWDGEDDKEPTLDPIFQPWDRVVHPPEFFHANYRAPEGISPPCVHSWMVRKSAIDTIGPFDPYMLTYEDQKFLGELSLRFPIYVASSCLCEYRRKQTSLWASAMATGSDVIARDRFAKWVAEAATGR